MLISEEHKKHFLQLYAIALADEEVSPKELRYLHDFAMQKGIPVADVESLLLTPVFSEINKPESLSEKIEHLYFATGMTLADGVVEKREILILRNICQHFGFIEQNIDEIIAFMLDEVRKGTSLMDVQALVKLNMLT